MNRLSRTLAATALATAVLGPGTAMAADIDLAGAPTLRQVDRTHATLRIAVDEKLGTAKHRIVFAGGQRVGRLEPAGRHGDDYVYVARVTSKKALRVGTKYTVTFRFAGQEPVTRKVKLHPERA